MKINFRYLLGYLFLIILVIFTVTILYLEKLFPEFFEFIPENLHSTFLKIIISILVLALLKLIMGAIAKIINREMEKRKISEQEIFFMSSLFKILFWIFAIFAILSIFFENVGSFITALGLIGAGLAIAMQHPILNFIGWIVILFNKPFLVGDRIEVENNNFDIRGDVVDITPFYTKIRKITKGDEKTGKLLHVPNSILIMNGLTNYTKGTGFLWDYIVFPLGYGSDIKKAKELIIQTAENVLSKYTRLEIKEKRKYTDEKVPEKPIISIESKDKHIEIKVLYLVDSKYKQEIRTEIVEEAHNLLIKCPETKLA